MVSVNKNLASVFHALQRFNSIPSPFVASILISKPVVADTGAKAVCVPILVEYSLVPAVDTTFVAVSVLTGSAFQAAAIDMT